MRVEGALFLSHGVNPKSDALARASKDGFVFVMQQANGAAVEKEEQPNGAVRLTIYKGVAKDPDFWDYTIGDEVVHIDFEIERLLEPDTQYQLKNPLFDCERFVERIFGIENDAWKPL